MKWIETALPSPAENLAVDEALLEQSEAGGNEEWLHFWEPSTTFVVVGYGNKVAMEVNLAACQARGIPIFRRCSGGGTVVQMPGGLNYSVILRITSDGPTRSISAANEFIMDKNRAALQTLAGELGKLGLSTDISVRGYTDLCLGNLKFAGNSQRRQKNFLLFHGTLLLNCDLKLIGELLRMPSLEPDYRLGRSHLDFVTNLNLPADVVKSALVREWQAVQAGPELPLANIHRLVHEKYTMPEWNFKF